MPELARAARGLGWQDVSTYLRSGNLLFSADGTDAEVAAALVGAVRDDLGAVIEVVIRSGPQLTALLAQHPFAEGDPARTVIACADRVLSEQVVGELQRRATGKEKVLVVGADVFAAFPDGQAGSTLASVMAKVAEPAVLTARNLNTMRALAARLDA